MGDNILKLLFFLQIDSGFESSTLQANYYQKQNPQNICSSNVVLYHWISNWVYFFPTRSIHPFQRMRYSICFTSQCIHHKNYGICCLYYCHAYQLYYSVSQITRKYNGIKRFCSKQPFQIDLCLLVNIDLFPVAVSPFFFACGCNKLSCRTVSIVYPCFTGY